MEKFDFLFQEEQSSFRSYSKKIDRSGHFYHVTQQGYSFGNTFSLNSAKYRMHMLDELCRRNKVLPLCNIVMPTHTHDIFYSEDFRNIQKTLQTLNTAVSNFITAEKETVRKYKEPVFSNHPSYEVIKEKEHLFYLFKYLYENPQYL